VDEKVKLSEPSVYTQTTTAWHQLDFNSKIGLPHIGRSRRKHALGFLKVAEDLIKNYGSKGTITFADGDTFEKLKNNLNFMETRTVSLNTRTRS